MKLENFQYKIYAARENNYYRVRAVSADQYHDFHVHHSPSLKYTVVVSDEISALLEDRLADEAFLLRAKLTSIFITHQTAIDAATERSTDFVEVYIP